MAAAYVGEFEQQLLLVILRLGAEAHGAAMVRELETRAGRRVTRGALYATLDRLETKGLVRWKLSPGGSARDGLPRRQYAVTGAGVAAVSSSRDVLRRLWQGIEHVLKEPNA